MYVQSSLGQSLDLTITCTSIKSLNNTISIIYLKPDHLTKVERLGPKGDWIRSVQYINQVNIA